MSENGNGVKEGPKVFARYQKQGMGDGDEVVLEVRGGPEDTLDEVVEVWDERWADLQESVNKEDPTIHHEREVS